MMYYLSLFYVDKEGVIAKQDIKTGQTRILLKELKYFYKQTRILKT